PSAPRPCPARGRSWEWGPRSAGRSARRRPRRRYRRAGRAPRDAPRPGWPRQTPCAAPRPEKRARREVGLRSADGCDAAPRLVFAIQSTTSPVGLCSETGGARPVVPYAPMPLPPARTRFLTAALLAILEATLWPFPGQEPEGFISCIACGDHATSDVLLNILLFAPLGAALALELSSVTRCALSAALLSATIELAQLYIPGRDSSLGDVLSNTLGGTLGAPFTRMAVLWLLPSPARAARLSRTAALAAAAVCWATGVLLTPTFPDAPYYGQWTPSLAHLELYHGRVLAAMLSGLPITPGPIPDSRLVRERLAAPQGFSLRVRAVAGPRTPALAPLFAIYDDHERELVLLAPDRDDLVLRVRTL